MTQYLHQESLFANGFNPVQRQQHAAKLQAIEGMRYARKVNAGGLNRSIVQKQLGSCERMSLVNTRAGSYGVSAVLEDPEMHWNKEYNRQIAQRNKLYARNMPKHEQKYQIITNEKPGQDALAEANRNRQVKKDLDNEVNARYRNVDKLMNEERAMKAFKTSKERSENTLTQRMPSGIDQTIDPENNYMRSKNEAYFIENADRKNTSEIQFELRNVLDNLIKFSTDISKTGIKLDKTTKSAIEKDMHNMQLIIEADSITNDQKRMAIGKLTQRVRATVIANVKADGENIIYAMQAVKLFNQVNDKKDKISYNTVFEQLNPIMRMIASKTYDSVKGVSKEFNPQLFEKNFNILKGLASFAMGVAYNKKKLSEMKQYILDQKLDTETVAYVMSGMEKQMALRNEKLVAAPREDIMAYKAMMTISTHYRNSATGKHEQQAVPKMEEGSNVDQLSKPKETYLTGDPVLRDRKVARENMSSMLDKELKPQDSTKPQHGIRGVKPKHGYAIF